MSRTAVTYMEIQAFPGFLAGSDGSVWSKWKMKGIRERSGGTRPILTETCKELMPTYLKAKGRKMYRVRTKDGRYLSQPGGRLVLLAFVGDPPQGTECCHNDGDCTNDALSNLRWGTRQSNVDDREKHGTTIIVHQPGSKNGRSKLTESDVIGIRERHASGYSVSETAREFGVSTTSIYLLLKRKTWTSV